MTQRLFNNFSRSKAPSDRIHPGKAPRKMIYILPLEEHIQKSMYND